MHRSKEHLNLISALSIDPNGPGSGLPRHGTFTYTVEGALDDLQQTSSASVAWFALSSARTANSSINIFSGALAGIRLNASAVSSATLTLRILQGIGQ